ncbi:LysR family transcriptional regulator [Neorhizobium alkalisoli]|uniref:HTH-type transcriptional regulator TtuA n=1 Tax=Neorhizobium alkalisoli TaxID=528178 RepID=A0A561QNX1_9HYPH|nr:LysR family transcriptional regulator [Neorhizobium alkalisoli]TWF52047.1 LysR family tcuABC transcriptional regulator/LysR family nitrogen assimilation transcriptional regulator [Neorhizobium alkalisoli]
MDLHQLKLFVHVYEAGSLSAAAERGRLAVSAVSLHLSNLEAELGTLLFHRVPRGMRPTSAGERLILHARGILGSVETARADMLGTTAPVSGVLRVGMASSAVAAFGGAFLSAMSAQFPLVDLSISDSVPSDRLVEILEGEFDLAIAFNPVTHPQLDCRPLLRERLFCMGLPNMLAEGADPISLKEVLDIPLILPRQGEGMRALTGEHAWLKKIEAKAHMQPGSGLAIKEALFQGLGATIASPLLVSHDVRAADLVIRPIVEPQLWRTLALCSHRGRPETSAKEACISTIRSLVKTLLASDTWVGAEAPEA